MSYKFKSKLTQSSPHLQIYKSEREKNSRVMMVLFRLKLFSKDLKLLSAVETAIHQHIFNVDQQIHKETGYSEL